MLVAKWVPTPCYNDAYLVSTPRWALWEKGWLKHCKTMIFPFLGRFFVGKQKDFLFFGWVILWMFHIGRARHPGPGPRDFPPGQMSVEFINVGGWLTSGDLALDSCAQFLAVAEHRLIPSRAWSACHQLRKAGHHGLLPVKIRLLVVMLGLVLSVWVVLPFHSLHLSLLSFRSSSGWVGY